MSGDIAAIAAGLSEAREQFVGWIADRFQERHRPQLPRSDALVMAAGTLGYIEEECGLFGDPGFGWSEDDAHAIADEEIETCWESAP